MTTEDYAQSTILKRSPKQTRKNKATAPLIKLEPSSFAQPGRNGEAQKNLFPLEECFPEASVSQLPKAKTITLSVP